MTWMVVLGGLGYDFAAWEADGIIRVASGWYLEVPGRHGTLTWRISWEHAQWVVKWCILGTCPVGGKMVHPGGRKAYNLNDYKLTIYMLTRL